MTIHTPIESPIFSTNKITVNIAIADKVYIDSYPSMQF
jgi:hypothetical protein